MSENHIDFTGFKKPQPSTKTPETDAHAFDRITGIASPSGDVIGVEVAHKLERERDEVRVSVYEMKEWCKVQRHLCDLAISNQESWMRKWDVSQAERTQLRKVCDELAKELKWYWEPLPEGAFHPDNPVNQKSQALERYSTLPHVIKEKAK
jgi:hypothetical protein